MIQAHHSARRRWVEKPSRCLCTLGQRTSARVPTRQAGVPAPRPEDDGSYQIRVDEAIHVAHFSGGDGKGLTEHGAIVDEGMELAVFAAGVGGFRQGGEQVAVEFASGERDRKSV